MIVIMGRFVYNKSEETVIVMEKGAKKSTYIELGEILRASDFAT